MRTLHAVARVASWSTRVVGALSAADAKHASRPASLKFRVFPCDLEGVGCYRIIYPYGLIDRLTTHDVTIGSDGQLVQENGRILLSIPEAVLGGEHGAAAEEFLDADIYVIQRPLEKIYAPLVAWLKQHGKGVVVDLDDYVHGVSSKHKTARDIARSDRHSFEVPSRCFPYTDLLTVSTSELADLYGDLVPRCLVLPNRLLRADWDQIEPAFSLERGKIRVGWQGWLAYRGDDLRVLKRMMRKWLRKHPDVVFVNVGKPDALTYMDIPRDQRLHVQGAKFPGHAPLVAEIDIGLVPLALTTFNDAKSALKGMEYGACGIPVIASPAREYRTWVDEGVNGYLAREPAEWMDALDAMLEDGRWRRMGKANLAKARANWVEDHWADWLRPYAKTA